jgi:hypothetical protein
MQASSTKLKRQISEKECHMVLIRLLISIVPLEGKNNHSGKFTDVIMIYLLLEAFTSGHHVPQQ